MKNYTCSYHTPGACLSPGILFKIIMRLQLITVLMIAALLQAGATGYGQGVTINEKQVSVEKILGQIERQTGYVFFYNSQDLSNIKISFRLRNTSSLEAIDLLFRDLPLTYKIIGNTVAIKKKEQPRAVILPDVLNSLSAPPETIITGRVLDEKEQPLPGVSILLKGSQTGTITNASGSYTLNLPDNPSSATLVFSFVGYKTREITVTGSRNLTVRLEPAVANLEEIVVVGYGKQLRSDITNSISKLDSKVLENSARGSLATALQGTIPGLRVINDSGQPGATPGVLLRGGVSIDSEGWPLTIVDGVVRAINDLNYADVESIEVLKDAASTAIYGARANNGVILITTKKGKAGASEISYSFKTGFNKLRKTYDYLNARDYLYYTRLGVKNTNASRAQGLINPVSPLNQTGFGVNLPNIYSVIALNNSNRSEFAGLLSQGWQWMIDPYTESDTLVFRDYGTQIQDATFNDPARTHDHNLRFSGGNERGRFSTSLGYYSEDGLVIGTSYKRFSGTLNGTYKVKKNLEVGGGVLFSQSSRPPLFIDQAALFYRIQSLWPTFKPFDDQGRPNSNNTALNGNPLYYQERNFKKNEVRRSTFNINAEWEIIKDLTLNVQANLNLNDAVNQAFNKALQYQTSPVPDVTRQATASYGTSLLQQHTLTLNYRKNIGKHTAQLLVGGEYFDESSFSLSATGAKAATDFIYTLNAATERNSISSSESQYRIQSAFGRLNYDFNRRYLLSAVFRYDGISRLAKGNNWGFFPGVSVGWNLHEEDFFVNSDLKKYVSAVKPRISYGVNGNVNGLGNYEVQGGYGTQTPYGGQAGFLNTSILNTSLRWEKSASLDIGADISLLNNRVTLLFDYFSRTTSDLLTDISLPGYTGFGSVRSNLGSLLNKGFEADLNARIISRPNGLNWSVGFNTAFVKNRILKLPYNGNERNRVGGFEVYDPVAGKNVWVGGHQEGNQLGDLFGYKQIRILKDWEDVEKSAANVYDAIAELYGPAAYAALTNKTGKFPIEPGDALWADLNNDGVINSLDRVKVGNLNPRYTGGMSSTLSYKKIALYTRFDYGLGHTIYNDLLARTLGQMQGTLNISTEVYDMWSPENPTSDLPRVYYADQVGKKNITRSNDGAVALHNNSSRFYEKGDYLALREATLSYELPYELASRIKLTSVRFHLTGQNLSYFTRYTGTNPELGGLDAGRYPLPKTIIFGVQVSL